MPVYNEARSIANFLKELFHVFNEKFDLYFVIVNDSSTDDTLEVLESISKQVNQIHIINNVANLGHGPSTLLALEFAIQKSPYIIMNLDGDGNYFSDELSNFLERFIESRASVGEGIRINRQDPLYRSIVTGLVSYLVKFNCGVRPQDANTPCRIFYPNDLAFLLKTLPPATMIPNLHLSAAVRKNSLIVFEHLIKHNSRMGTNALGVSWNNKFRNLPSKRFIKFTYKALKEWFIYQKK
jgi:glycosyltransferase involved in cell wall biosynthesis